MPIETKFWNSFSGWSPNNDAINGDKTQLLQMSNVELDKNGALSLQYGTSVLRTFGDSPANGMYSRFLSGTRYDYTALNSGKVFRNSTQLTAGGSTVRTGFSSAFDNTLITSGTYRVKDSGTSVANLGIGAPTSAPTLQTLTYKTTPFIHNGTDVNAFHGTSGTTANIGGFDFLQTFQNDGTDFVFLFTTYDSANVTDTTVLTQTDFGSTTTPYDPNDVFIVNPFSIDGSGNPNSAGTDMSGVVQIQVAILLSPPSSLSPTIEFASDYYVYTWTSDIAANGDDVRVVSPSNILLAIRRAQFQRIGSDTTKSWATVVGYSIAFGFSGAQSSPAGLYLPQIFQGGYAGMLTGNIQYAQMNIAKTASYTAKSVLGPIATLAGVTDAGAAILAQTPVDAQVTEVWIFRRDGGLSEWYRTLVIPLASVGTKQIDVTNNADVITEDVTVNLNLVSAASTGISEAIVEIIGPIEGRWYYLTPTFLYPSDIYDPDLVDVSEGVRISGSLSEVFLWAKKISEAVILIGTSVDIYVLSGTFTTLADGSIDIYYRPLGCKYPPITRDAAFFSGTVYYLADAGWTSINQNGQNQILVEPNTSLLYHNESRYGYTGISLTGHAADSISLPIVATKSKLWCIVTGTGRIEVYDFVRQYWRPCEYGLGDASGLCETQDGLILAYYAGDNNQRVLNDQTTKLVDGATPQLVKILSVAQDGENPRNRKDFSTFKSRIYTSGGAVDVQLNTDIAQFDLGNISSVGLNQEAFIDAQKIVPLPLKWWQFQLSGSVNDLNLQDCSIDLDMRPTPVTYIRSRNQNFNTAGRKRFRVWPQIVDTLGQDIPCQLFVDGNNLYNTIINTSNKTTVKFEIPGDQFGVDFEMILHSPTFEFEHWGFETPDFDAAPIPRAYYKSFKTNFGTPNKKRLRVWPLVLNTLGNNVNVNVYADGAVVGTLLVNNNDKITCFVQVEIDAFGVDYEIEIVPVVAGNLFEFWEVLQPEIVQHLPIAKRFDQIGPTEFFRYGRIQKLDVRLLPYGTAIPYRIYFSDMSFVDGILNVLSGVEGSYTIGLPKGTGGQIFRLELGPTPTFDFHRYNIRVLINKSGTDTEGQWLSIG